MRRHLKSGILAALSGATGRPAVLLSPEAARDDGILALRTRYRVDASETVVTVDEPEGRLVAALHLENGREPAWCSRELVCVEGARLTLSLSDGTVRYRGQPLGSVSGGAAVTARRLTWSLVLTLRDGARKARRTSHYIARPASTPVDAGYFAGDDYTDYEAQSASVHDHVCELVRLHGARGPVLEIGAATGGTLARLQEEGLSGTGVDISPWAAARANERLGGGAVHVADVDREPLPAAVAARGPFGVLVMASVFEHLADPFEALARLGTHVRRGGHLLLITTNADSLTHRLFGTDWEGYFDWTHRGVDLVSAAAVRRELPALGWDIASLRTWHVWDGDADPTKAALREWCDADARFRRLLEERDLGDFLECVAVRR